VLVGWVEADLGIGFQRHRDLVAHELLEGLAGGTPDHLTDQMSVVDGVVAGRRSRRPPRFLACQVLG
jgi:hypothetical protein